MIPESSRYEFRQRLSENPHTQSWLALRRDTGSLCFVKCASDSGDLPVEEKREMLRRSFRLQTRIRTCSIYTANSLSTDHGNVFVEYPYLAADRLCEVSVSMLLEPSRELLVRLAVVIDYLHLLDVVHCDLKLENFRLLKHARGERLILMDLDNLQESGEPSRHRVFGSIDCIPPEILNNDRICGGSDLFSMGRSIQAGGASKASDLEPGRSADVTSERLHNLIDRLTQASPAARPEMLLRGLHFANLINDDQYQHGLKTTLAMLLLTNYRALRANGRFSKADLQRDLFQASRLYSLPHDLCECLQQTLLTGTMIAFETVKEILTASKCERCGEFWYLAIPDETLLRIFSRFPDESESVEEAVCRADSRDSESSKDTDSSEMFPTGKGLRSYLIRKNRVTSELEAGRSIPLSEFRGLAGLAVALHRPLEASEHIQHAIEVAVPSSDEQLELYAFYARELWAANKEEAASAANDKGLELARSCSRKAAELDFRKQQAWRIGHAGNIAESVRLLAQIAVEAEELHLHEFQARVLGDLAAMWRSGGHLDEAAATYDKCFRLADARQYGPHLTGTLCGAASLCFETAKYRRAISYAKTALKYIDRRQQSHFLSYICDYMIASHTRLAEYDKADYWSGRSLGLIHAAARDDGYAIHYSLVGWSKMVRGDLADAELALQRVLEISPAGRAYSIECHSLRNLCEIAFYRAELNELERLNDLTRKALKAYPDVVLSLELDMIIGLKDFYYDQKCDLDYLGRLVISLDEGGCRYYAAMLLYIVLIESDRPWREENRLLVQKVMAHVPSDETPLFRALHNTVEPYIADVASVPDMIAALRNAYRYFESAGQWFLAMITCVGIARLHYDDRQPRLGARFTRQAISLAERLGNRRFVQLLSDLLKEKASLVHERRVLVQSFDGIAEILSNISQEIDPLPRLLKFAVDAVEAERGVLLVCSHDSDDLRVRCFVGCEAEDLQDVVSFSRNIPKMALSSMSPVFVSDALADDATKKYKSIVAHNIRSVICVPIAVEGRARGVIYLDHHTIPALFDEEDLTFVGALSKFASLIFDTYAKYRSSKNLTEYLEKGLNDIGVGISFVTRSETLRRLLGPLPQIAASDTSVLVRGESGTGKEIICRMIHSSSARKDGPFIKLNCAAIAPTLVESELFGVADRTATGVAARKGKFEAADGGTLFLDEVGDMPLAVQAKVLRVLEYQEFEPVGSNTTISTDVRFIYATNKDLAEMVAQKKFRADLYYRINGVEIAIPPLRERPEDVEVLCDHFIALFSQTTHKPISLSGRALSVLESYPWPGNVRELRNVIERLSLLCPGKTIQMGDLPSEIVNLSVADEPTSLAAEAAERAQMLRALTKHNWNKSAAARSMGMPLSTFCRKMRKYGLRRP